MTLYRYGTCSMCQNDNAKHHVMRDQRNMNRLVIRKQSYCTDCAVKYDSDYWSSVSVAHSTRPWTPSEVALLKVLWEQNIKVIDICVRLNRSVGSVNRKRRDLRLDPRQGSLRELFFQYGLES